MIIETDNEKPKSNIGKTVKIYNVGHTGSVMSPYSFASVISENRGMAFVKAHCGCGLNINTDRLIDKIKTGESIKHHHSIWR